MLKFILFLLNINLVYGMCYASGYIVSCNDIEMFEQCHYAQMRLNKYAHEIIQINKTYQLTNLVPNLHCDKHVYCKPKDFWNCQNMDSYNSCKSATGLLDEFISVAKNYVTIDPVMLNNKPVFICEYKEGPEKYYESSGSRTSILWIFVFVIIALLSY